VRHQCADGIDRDKEIDRYILLEQRRRGIQCSIEAAQRKLTKIDRERLKVLDQLGQTGYDTAVRELQIIRDRQARKREGQR
jgi:hypothetical protein